MRHKTLLFLYFMLIAIVYCDFHTNTGEFKAPNFNLQLIMPVGFVVIVSLGFCGVF